MCSSTSLMPVMGLASIGLTGTPGWNFTTPARPCMRVQCNCFKTACVSTRRLCGENRCKRSDSDGER